MKYLLFLSLLACACGQTAKPGAGAGSGSIRFLNSTTTMRPWPDSAKDSGGVISYSLGESEVIHPTCAEFKESSGMQWKSLWDKDSILETRDGVQWLTLHIPTNWIHKSSDASREDKLIVGAICNFTPEGDGVYDSIGQLVYTQRGHCLPILLVWWEGHGWIPYLEGKKNHIWKESHNTTFLHADQEWSWDTVNSNKKH